MQPQKTIISKRDIARLRLSLISIQPGLYNLLTLRKEAELDISEIFKFYEEHRLGLRHDFILCIDAAISKIEQNPLHLQKNLQRAKFLFPKLFHVVLPPYLSLVLTVIPAPHHP